MKRYSLRRRLIAAVLLLECALVAGLITLWGAGLGQFQQGQLTRVMIYAIAIAGPRMRYEIARMLTTDRFSHLLGAVGLVCLVGCARGRSPSREEEPSPSASVITIGAGVGTCSDLAVCASECDAGSADRCRRLAATYALGTGVERDEGRATELYEHACAMADPAACTFAGQMHEFARGVAKNDTAAAAFYERSCNLKWAAGCYNQAIMVERGRGVPADRVKAASLYDVACEAGAKVACERAKELREPAPAVPPAAVEAGAP